jgi:hypothetical protein
LKGYGKVLVHAELRDLIDVDALTIRTVAEYEPKSLRNYVVGEATRARWALRCRRTSGMVTGPSTGEPLGTRPAIRKAEALVRPTLQPAMARTRQARNQTKWPTPTLSPDAGLRHSLPVAVSAHEESPFKGLIAFGEIG